MGFSLPHYAYGFVTLGNGIDELSELYLNHEQIQEAYIVDCISLLLLSKAYAEFAHVVEDQSGLYPLQNYLFWEIPIPLICFHRSMSALRRMQSGLTEGQMLLPLKTAALILHLDTNTHARPQDNYVIPAQPVRIFPVLPENLGSAGSAAYLWCHADIPYNIAF